MPPAGHEEAIAYRPACHQLTPSAQDGLTHWQVSLTDGRPYTLATMPSQPLPDAYAAMDASGLCKVGGADVPIMTPEDAIASQPSRLTVTPVMVQPSSNLPSILLMVGLVVLVIGGWFISQQQRRDRADWIEGGE